MKINGNLFLQFASLNFSLFPVKEQSSEPAFGSYPIVSSVLSGRGIHSSHFCDNPVSEPLDHQGQSYKQV